MDLLAGVSREFTKDLTAPFLPDEFKAQALDFQFHWVTEHGDTPGRVTSGLNVQPTVCEFQ